MSRWGVVLCAVLVGVAAFVGSLTRLSSFDTFHHLAYGREVMRQGGFPAEEPFLYPLAGRPTGASPEWLSSILIYFSFWLAGSAGPVLLAGLMGAALGIFLLIDALDGERTWVGLLTALVPVALALAVFRERSVARPELFSNVLLAGTMLALRGYARGRTRILFYWPLAFVLWGNLHPSFLMGVAVLGLFVLVNGALLGIRRLVARGLPVELRSPRSLLAPTVVTLGCLAAGAFLNPTGSGTIASALDFVGSLTIGSGQASASLATGQVVQRVGELRPATHAQLHGPFGWLIVLAVLSLGLGFRELNLREAVTVVPFLYLGITAQRFLVIAAIVTAPVAAHHLRAGRRWLMDRSERRTPMMSGALIAASIAVIGLSVRAAALLPAVSFGVGMGREIPVRASRYLRGIGFDGRLFNTFHLGGYLEWSLDQKVFQDGRGLLRPEDRTGAFSGPSAYVPFAELDARYEFDALVVHYPQFTDGTFAERSPREDWGADRRVWALVAFDDGGQVYLRRDGRFSESAARDEYRFAMPTNPVVLPRVVPVAGLKADLTRSLEETPDCLRCQLMAGALAVDQGHFDEAENLLAGPAKEGMIETRLYALLKLAEAAEGRGQRDAAVHIWRRILPLAPDPTFSRRQLARLLLDAGRLEEAWKEILPNLDSGAWPDDVMLAIRIARARGDEANVRALTVRFGQGGVR